MQEVPLLVLRLPKSHTKAIKCMPQMVTYAAVEKGMEHKGEQRCYLHVLPNVGMFSNTLLTKLSSQLLYSLSSMLLFGEVLIKYLGCFLFSFA